MLRLGILRIRKSGGVWVLKGEKEGNIAYERIGMEVGLRHKFLSWSVSREKPVE